MRKKEKRKAFFFGIVSDGYGAKMSGHDRTQCEAELMISTLYTLEVQRDLSDRPVAPAVNCRPHKG